MKKKEIAELLETLDGEQHRLIHGPWTKEEIEIKLLEMDRDILMGFIIEGERGMGMSDYCHKKLVELYKKKVDERI